MEPPIDRLLRISNAKANADLKSAIGSRSSAQDLTHKKRDPSTGLTIVQNPSGGLAQTRAMHNSLDGSGDPVAMFQAGANGIGTIDGKDVVKKKKVLDRQLRSSIGYIFSYTKEDQETLFWLGGHQKDPVFLAEIPGVSSYSQTSRSNIGHGSGVPVTTDSGSASGSAVTGPFSDVIVQVTLLTNGYSSATLELTLGTGGSFTLQIPSSLPGVLTENNIESRILGPLASILPDDFSYSWSAVGIPSATQYGMTVIRTYTYAADPPVLAPASYQAHLTNTGAGFNCLIKRGVSITVQRSVYKVKGRRATHLTTFPASDWQKPADIENLVIPDTDSICLNDFFSQILGTRWANLVGRDLLWIEPSIALKNLLKQESNPFQIEVLKQGYRDGSVSCEVTPKTTKQVKTWPIAAKLTELGVDPANVRIDTISAWI